MRPLLLKFASVSICFETSCNCFVSCFNKIRAKQIFLIFINFCYAYIFPTFLAILVSRKFRKHRISVIGMRASVISIRRKRYLCQSLLHRAVGILRKR